MENNPKAEDDRFILDALLAVEHRVKALANTCGMHEDADDFWQDLCVRVLKKRGRYDWSQPQKGRLIVIARNMLRDILRQRRRHVRPGALELVGEPTAKTLSPFQETAIVEICRMVRKRVEALPVKERELVNKRFYDRKGYAPNCKSTDRTTLWRLRRRWGGDVSLRKLCER